MLIILTSNFLDNLKLFENLEQLHLKSINITPEQLNKSSASTATTQSSSSTTTTQTEEYYFKKLHSLTILHCKNISTSDIMEIIRRSRSLRRLIVSSSFFGPPTTTTPTPTPTTTPTPSSSSNTPVSSPSDSPRTPSSPLNHECNYDGENMLNFVLSESITYIKIDDREVDEVRDLDLFNETSSNDNNDTFVVGEEVRVYKSSTSPSSSMMSRITTSECSKRSFLS
eukprot:TRINITY_DN5730_c0_g1_i2.p1 TRINITY_DN5730_c0_g1~~TRINITY_DN5730_c0_g1_i2.p1  ORF type:complete len:226 (+),score=78.40 TRINITY_DN5730_c0_g1_i2:501-1178(+)